MLLTRLHLTSRNCRLYPSADVSARAPHASLQPNHARARLASRRPIWLRRPSSLDDTACHAYAKNKRASQIPPRPGTPPQPPVPSPGTRQGCIWAADWLFPGRHPGNKPRPTNDSRGINRTQPTQPRESNPLTQIVPGNKPSPTNPARLKQPGKLLPARLTAPSNAFPPPKATPRNSCPLTYSSVRAIQLRPPSIPPQIPGPQRLKPSPSRARRSKSSPRQHRHRHQASAQPADAQAPRRESRARPA